MTDIRLQLARCHPVTMTGVATRHKSKVPRTQWRRVHHPFGWSGYPAARSRTRCYHCYNRQPPLFICQYQVWRNASESRQEYSVCRTFQQMAILWRMNCNAPLGATGRDSLLAGRHDFHQTSSSRPRATPSTRTSHRTLWTNFANHRRWTLDCGRDCSAWPT